MYFKHSVPYNPIDFGFFIFFPDKLFPAYMCGPSPKKKTFFTVS